MARMRMIKPEFWTSEQVMECSPNARLLFVGLWNFCDDGGNHPVGYKTLKAEVFPADDFTAADVERMVAELILVELLEEYEVDGRGYWHVTGWHHQKIDQPTFKHPKPDGTIPEGAARRRSVAKTSPNNQRTFDDGSPNNRQEIAEQSPNNQRTFDECSPPEGKGREGSKPTNPNGLVVVGPSDVDPCPHQQIIDAYHELLPACIPVKVWNDYRRTMLKTRWREDKKRQRVEWWRKFFGYIADSRFLTGQADAQPGREPFVADLEWIIKPQNFAKIIEGKYHQTEAASA